MAKLEQRRYNKRKSGVSSIMKQRICTLFQEEKENVYI